MFAIGEIIDNKYRVTSICSDLGGMGTILHVDPLTSTYPFPLVLKYCKASDAISKTRFVRELRYLKGFKGNSMVLQILDHNLDFDPPYFVMKFYNDGDSSLLAARIQTDINYQEAVFNKMLDCIAELHAQGIHHRDIKPQNFLVEGNNIIVSDLGLAKAIGAGTTFTMSHEYWGTQGFLPPEFFHCGFKASTPSSDIFMIGKTFYSLLTGRDPIYLTDLGLQTALYHVIERCCELNPVYRYQTISELRQDLKLAYDVLLRRTQAIGTARQLLSRILNKLNGENKYVAEEVIEFLDLLAKLTENERSALSFEMPKIFYLVLAQSPLETRLGKFLEQYREFSHNAVSTWSYAETVADYMKIIFDRSSLIAHRSKALDIAIDAAVRANRFAAMDTCKDMVASVSDPNLGIAVASVISRHRGTFVASIEISNCHDDAVRNAILAINKSAE